MKLAFLFYFLYIFCSRCTKCLDFQIVCNYFYKNKLFFKKMLLFELWHINIKKASVAYCSCMERFWNLCGISRGDKYIVPPYCSQVAQIVKQRSVSWAEETHKRGNDNIYNIYVSRTPKMPQIGCYLQKSFIFLFPAKDTKSTEDLLTLSSDML